MRYMISKYQLPYGKIIPGDVGTLYAPLYITAGQYVQHSNPTVMSNVPKLRQQGSSDQDPGCDNLANQKQPVAPRT